MSKQEAWSALNKALVEFREADQRGDKELARKKYGEFMSYAEALGRMMRT